MINETEHRSNLTTNLSNYTHINEDIKTAYNILVIFLIIFIMTSMGANICWKQIWMHVRKPFGPIIGLVCQFLMMPLVGFIYNKIFKFKPEMAAGLLIMSCCPGGVVSNIFSYYLNGDVSLSVTMTTVSTILALGMMPLNVWIYSIRTESSTLIIPYKSIALSLILIISPVLVGMAIRWKAPKVSVYVTKGGSALGFIFLIIVTMLKFVMFKNWLHQISWKFIIASTCMPITGILLGYFIALICRRSNAVCKTIAIESGIQNAAVAFSVIILSFDIRKYFTILFIPWFYGLSQSVICALLCLFHHILIKYCKRVQSTQEAVEIVRKKDIVMKPSSTIPT
ncbi:ileal sodium/bile acid cotransporter-like isoform X2 [Centruroides sculpturatus]|uniref:ileal sodium/bile acid cotransporter-like isoform X2 n=1 Tax=Centruroides sculpturatus TaxID=218467 RepID=UPI000C6D3903|nr:ileal sodium/bile acid cotransporter-like isoform X2 [Centruroides sculpturatus]